MKSAQYYRLLIFHVPLWQTCILPRNLAKPNKAGCRLACESFTLVLLTSAG